MTSPSDSPKRKATGEVGRSALLVAAGIFLSRISGLIRDRTFSHYLGLSDAADAFRAALKIPNFLQTLFGEGVLSASFIPVYAKLLAEEKREDAGRVAGAIFSILALVTSLIVAGGILVTPIIMPLLAPGFTGEKRELTIRLIRILFPGVGLLVLSAWCLGILNSHRRFFLSYVSPVIWNAAIVTVLIYFGSRVDQSSLVVHAAWASVVGSGLQFLIQLPVVLKLVPNLRVAFQTANRNVRIVLGNFIPVFVSRGVVQVSAYVDTTLASLLPTGAVSSLSYAQTLYLLPVSLFGMSVSVAELPAMSSALGSHDEVAAVIRQRIASSIRRIGFFVIPSAVAFLALGDIVAGAIYITGRFTQSDAVFVWGILAGSAVGLVAQTTGRLYSSGYYALRDTRTPLRFAVVRVVLTTGMGYLFAVPLPKLLGIDASWGVAGLTSSAGIAAWVEFLLLRRGMNRRIGTVEFPTVVLGKLWLSAMIGAAVAWGLRLALHPHQPQIAAIVILVPYGLVYLGMTMVFGIDEARGLLRRVIK
ncbi:MAG TPA: murein biosynthesis integral membrane protein MurJ [Terriglobia bacterium]|nr:murein biosynthesis integral membrane protein MurJ [Terriglobia bacterium]